MLILPLIVNGVVIVVIGGELIAIALGMASADELLLVSAISGLLTLMSFKLSKDALSRRERASKLLSDNANNDD